MVRTPGFHPGNRGSIPLRATSSMAINHTLIGMLVTSFLLCSCAQKQSPKVAQESSAYSKVSNYYKNPPDSYVIRESISSGMGDLCTYKSIDGTIFLKPYSFYVQSDVPLMSARNWCDRSHQIEVYEADDTSETGLGASVFWAKRGNGKLFFKENTNIDTIPVETLCLKLPQMIADSDAATDMGINIHQQFLCDALEKDGVPILAIVSITKPIEGPDAPIGFLLAFNNEDILQFYPIVTFPTIKEGINQIMKDFRDENPGVRFFPPKDPAAAQAWSGISDFVESAFTEKNQDLLSAMDILRAFRDRISFDGPE